jgi:hypothetical protein
MEQAAEARDPDVVGRRRPAGGERVLHVLGDERTEEALVGHR